MAAGLRSRRSARFRSSATPIVFANNFPPDHGGIQRYMGRIADELHASGRRVIVVAPDFSGADAYDAARQYRIFRYRGTSKLASTASMLVAYLRALRLQPGDYTIASIWFPTGVAAVLLPRILRGKVGIIAHGTEIAPSRGGARRWIMRAVYARADHVIANSGFTRGLLERAGVRRRVDVVPCGVDASPPLPERTTSQPTILSVGRLVPRKGFDSTIAALPQVLAHFPGARYEIVGDGPLLGRLRALAETAGVAHAVRFLGSIDDEALARTYTRATCFVLPVRAEGDDVEGFGIVYLEAAMAALPVIGGRDSGAEEAIADGETGFVVDGRDVAAIAAAIVTLCEDEARARAMGNRGRERALTLFLWSRTVGAIAELMERT